MSEYILQYASDLHLELRKVNNIPIIEPVAKENCCLALCGDIGNPFLETYKAFLDIHTKLYAHILIISGNHEYYTSRSNQHTMTDAEKLLYNISRGYGNVTYMNMDAVIIGRTKFIGCTFWSDISHIMEIAEDMMNDYKNIYVENIGMTPTKITTFDGLRINTKVIKEGRSQLRSKHILALHRRMKSWIQYEIEKHKNDEDKKYDDIIVLTHHAPSFKMLDRSDIYSACYGTNCENLMGSDIKYWISGHTHTSKEVEINGTTCLSNCMGYPGQKFTYFDDKKHIIFK